MKSHYRNQYNRKRNTRRRSNRRKYSRGGMIRTLKDKQFKRRYLHGNDYDLSRAQLNAFDRADTARLNALEASRISQSLPFAPSPEYPPMPASNLEVALEDEKYIHIDKDIIAAHITPSWSITMRFILFEWMQDVCVRFYANDHVITYILAAQITDQFLTATTKKYTRGQYQLIGLAAMLLASKYENIQYPSLDDLIYTTAGAYTKKELIDMETAIVTVLTHPYAPTLYTFYQLKSDDLSAEHKKHLLCAVICASAAEQFIGMPPSKVVDMCIHYVQNTNTHNLPCRLQSLSNKGTTAAKFARLTEIADNIMAAATR